MEPGGGNRPDEPRWWAFLRDVAMFAGGLTGATYETLRAVPRPELLLLFAAMMGIPIITQSYGKKP